MRQITRDNLPHLVWCLQRYIQTRFDSLIIRLIARWWGVSLGKNCECRGLPIIRRHPGSRIEIGDGCSFNSNPKAHQGGIARPCILWTLSEHARIQIGGGCGFSGTVISAEREILIGRRVRCGTNTRIMDSDMHSDDRRVSGAKPVVLEDDVWLGMNTLVVKGVTIGRGTLVGANSLVNKSMPAHVVAAGIPARVIRETKITDNRKR